MVQEKLREGEKEGVLSSILCMCLQLIIVMSGPLLSWQIQCTSSIWVKFKNNMVRS